MSVPQLPMLAKAAGKSGARCLPPTSGAPSSVGFVPDLKVPPNLVEKFLPIPEGFEFKPKSGGPSKPWIGPSPSVRRTPSGLALNQVKGLCGKCCCGAEAVLLNCNQPR